ncbi:MAG: hypothetical protein MK105_10945 [Crocinitomicaceae bacterium]|nr:hypothetical protein [Crocinitomicaceae bacterium]
MKNEKDIFDFIKSVKPEEPSADYFSGLADKILSENKTIVIPIYKKPTFWMTSAAAIGIILFSVLRLNNSTEIETPALLAFNNIEKIEIFEYIDDNIQDFDIDLFIESIPESTLDETDQTETLKEVKMTHEEPSITFDEISEEDILEYLNTEEIDITDLEEDLFI